MGLHSVAGLGMDRSALRAAFTWFGRLRAFVEIHERSVSTPVRLWPPKSSWNHAVHVRPGEVASFLVSLFLLGVAMNGYCR